MAISVGQLARPASETEDSPKGGKRRIKRELLASWWWAVPAIAIAVFIHYIMVGVGGVYAFTDWRGIGDYNWVGFDNFARVFEPGGLGLSALLNTLLLAFGYLVGTQVLGLGLALALNRTLKTRHFLRVVLFAPVVLSPLAVSYIWQFIFHHSGPLNGLLDGLGLTELKKAWLADPSTAIWTILVVMVWQSSGLVMVIYLAGLSGVPAELEEAAALDGATLTQRFLHVVLPLIRPAFVIASMLMLIQGLRVFDQVMALTGGGPFGATETLATQVYKQTFSNGFFGFGAALSLVLTVLIVALAMVQLFATRGKNH